MEMRNNLNVGDWVKGRLKDGELIHGYIESIGSLPDFVKVVVVASDNKKTIGKSTETLQHWVEKLPESSTQFEEDLSALIDLALLTGDSEWFAELSTQLLSVKNSSSGGSQPKFPIYRVYGMLQPKPKVTE